MNALEQEYRDNVAKASVREKRRIFVLSGIGSAIAGVACSCIAPGTAIIFAALTCANVVGAIIAPRLVPVTSVNTLVTDEPALGYRDAQPVAQHEVASPSAGTPWPRMLAALVVLGALLFLGWGHVSTRVVAHVATAIGFVLVIAGQRLHAAWKKRHDAKLMIEWERRLEEKR